MQNDSRKSNASKPRGWVPFLVCFCVAAILAGGVYMGLYHLPQQKINAAKQSLAENDYEAAKATYIDLSEATVLGITLSELPFGAYRQAHALLPEASYAQAEYLLTQADYGGASEAFAAAGGYADAASRVDEPYYAQGNACLAAGDFSGAVDAFERAGDFGDASLALPYSLGRAALADGRYIEAGDYLLQAKGYADADTRIAQNAANIQAEIDHEAALLPYKTVGSSITLGRYEQDNDAANGKEPLIWRVLSVHGDAAMLITEYAIDCKPYHDRFAIVSWENSTLRVWLNSAFYAGTFDDAEKRAIMPIPADLLNVSRFGTVADAAAFDLVSMLSHEDAAQYLPDDAARVAPCTAYARAGGAQTNASGAAPWWLRMTGYEGDDAMVAGGDGKINRGGIRVDDGATAIRPVIWINLEALDV